MKYIVKTLESFTGYRTFANYIEAESEEEALRAYKDGNVIDYEIIDEDIIDSSLEEIQDVYPI